MVRFLLQIPPPKPLPKSRIDVEALLERTRRLPIDVKRVRQCTAAGDCHRLSGNWSDATLHMNRGHWRATQHEELRKRTQDWDGFLAPADTLWRAMLARSPVPRLYGCP